MTFLTLALFALVHFGQVFWFLATVTCSLAALSLYQGFKALRDDSRERRP